MLKIIWEHYLFQNYPRERCYFALLVYSDLLIIFIVCVRASFDEVRDIEEIVL